MLPTACMLKNEEEQSLYFYNAFCGKKNVLRKTNST